MNHREMLAHRRDEETARITNEWLASTDACRIRIRAVHARWQVADDAAAAKEPKNDGRLFKAPKARKD